MTYRAIALHSSTGSLSTASAVLLTIEALAAFGISSSNRRAKFPQGSLVQRLDSPLIFNSLVVSNW